MYVCQSNQSCVELPCGQLLNPINQNVNTNLGSLNLSLNLSLSIFYIFIYEYICRSYNLYLSILSIYQSVYLSLPYQSKCLHNPRQPLSIYLNYLPFCLSESVLLTLAFLEVALLFLEDEKARFLLIIG